MPDRTVKVRLEADISDFVTDIGVKAVAAVNKLEASALKANRGIAHVGGDNQLDKLGTKADTVGTKLDKAGTKGEASGKKIAAGAEKASVELGKLAAAADQVNKSADEQAKSIDRASKSADSHANAIGRLRVAQLRLAEAQNSGKGGASLAGAEESVKAAERAVKKFEKAGDEGGRGFGKRLGAGIQKWFAGDGTSVFKQLGQNAGNGFFGALAGVLKTPVIGPIVAVALITAIESALIPAGAILAGGLVSAFGAGLATLGMVFAAKSAAVKTAWRDSMSSMGADLTLISQPFERTLISMAETARSTFSKLKPDLAAVFSSLAPVMSQFGRDLGSALAKLGPALQPLGHAFEAVLQSLGPALNDSLAKFSDGLRQLSASVSKSPTALADFVRGIFDLTNDLLSMIRILNDADGAFKRLTGISSVTALMDALRVAVDITVGPFIALAAAAGKLADAINALKHSREADGKSMSDAANHTVQLVQGMQRAAGAADKTGAALGRSAHETHAANVAATLLAGAYDRQAAATNKAIDALNRESDLLLSLSGAQINYAQAVADATQAIKDNGHTHDLSTQKGRDNQRALDAVTQSAKVQRDALLKAGDGNVAAAKSAEGSRRTFVKLAVQMGYGAAEARRMANDLIKIPNVSRTAKLNANITDLEGKLATAKAKLKDKTLTATQRAKIEADIRNILAGIATAKAALASVPPSKTVSITVNTYKNMVETTTHKDVGVRVPAPKVNADGGYYPKGIPSYADGKLPSQAMIAPGKGSGMVQWAEQETGGEAFIPLAPSKRDRSEKILGQVANTFGMGLVKSFANGGFNLPGGQLIDIATILQRLGIPFDPTGGANYSSTNAAANRANRAVVPARNNAIAAQRAEDSAKAQQAAIQRAITLQQRKIAATRAPKQTTKAGQAAEDKRVAAEQKKLIALQDSLYAAKQKVTKATKASNAADAVLKIRQEAAAKAVQANRDALEKLVQQQQAAVDMAKQISDGLQSSANIGDLFQKSLTGKGLLADLQDQGAALAKFRSQIDQLRKAGLSEDLIQQLVAKGSDQGGSAAGEILAGGLSLINALNRAQASLEQQANLIGAGSAAVKYGVQVAGKRALGGETQPGKAYIVGENGPEILRMGVTRGWVEPNRYVTNQSSFTRSTVIQQHNSFHGVSMAEADLIASRTQAKVELAARGY